MKIYIDPGHNYSGADTGAVGNGLREQEITYCIAKKIREKLENAGLAVRMSRNSLNENVGRGTVRSSLSARAEDANCWGADLFVSVHCNAGGGSGAETYCYQGGISSGFKLAQKIQAGLVQQTAMKNRGVKINPSLAVLKQTKMPAVLTEVGFIDHAGDAKVLGSRDGQERIAEAVAQGICDYLSIEYREEVTVVKNEELKHELDEMLETMKIFAVELENLKHPPVWNYIDENLPEWARPTVEKLVSRGLLKGDENGLRLTEELLRILVINDRAGLYAEA